jgi:hypothetical protein
VGTELDLKFEGKVRRRGRVVWQKGTDSHFENLVGLELLTPFKQSFLLGMANPSVLEATSSTSQSTPQQGSHPVKGISGDHPCSAK